MDGLNELHERLVLDEQRKLFLMWHGLREANGLVLRARLSPGAFAECLSHTSLLEWRGQSWRVRLAGSELFSAFGREARGLTIDALADVTDDQGFIDTLRCQPDGRPRAGLRCAGRSLMHTWMRLPVSSDGEQPDMLLGYDRWLNASELRSEDLAQADRRGGFSPPSGGFGNSGAQMLVHAA